MKKRQYRKRTAEDADTLSGKESTVDAQQEDLLEDLLELRRLQRKAHGSLEKKLLRGDSKARPRELGKPELATGPGDKQSLEAAFTTNTAGLDTKKHMEAFIEAELGRRLVGYSTANSAPEPRIPDIDRLYQVPAHLQRRYPHVVVDESDLTASATLLMAIPEVELGASSKVANILGTDQAVKQLENSCGKRATDKQALERFKKRVCR